MLTIRRGAEEEELLRFLETVNRARFLTADAGDYTWVAATVGSTNAAGYQLATGAPVMAVGGFNGTDPAPEAALENVYA